MLKIKPFHGNFLLGIVIIFCFWGITGCGAKENINEQIRLFLYENQPTNGDDFVRWAEKNLKNYSSREIDRALYAEGKNQAQNGHPNTVAVLSFSARSWAKKNGLPYNQTEWEELFSTAKEKEYRPTGELQLWPPQKK